MEQKGKDVYKTKDLGEASALLAKGQKLLFLSKEDSFYWFIFEQGRCQEFSSEYWFGELLVNARTYNDCMKTLKNRLHSQKT